MLPVQRAAAQALDIVNSSNDTLLHVQEDGKVGIGTSTPATQSQLHVASSNDYAGYFTSDNLSNKTHVIHAEYSGSSGSKSPTAVYGSAISNPGVGRVVAILLEATRA